jgi:hypothetical protein
MSEATSLWVGDAVRRVIRVAVVLGWADVSVSILNELAHEAIAWPMTSARRSELLFLAFNA